MPYVRLQKILADRGIASRREAEKFISLGAVSVNGEVVTEMGTKADPDRDIIVVKKDTLQTASQEKVTIALWKPLGVVSSSKKTEKEEHILTDLLPVRFPRLFSVGRLDKDSSGLILLTNDGSLAFELTHPRFFHSKTYHVLLAKPISEGAMEKIRRGTLHVLGEKIRPAKVTKLGGSRVEIILTEGKNRQIRRIFRSLGNGVKKLRRVAIGDLSLQKLGLAEGEWKILSKREINLTKEGKCLNNARQC
jgi:pseudouridine synthase